LFAEELSQIRETEQNADKMVKDARASSRKELSDADADAQRIISEAEDKAAGIYRGLIDEGGKDADTEYAEYMKGIDQKCSDMEAAAERSMEAAVDMIVERIVKPSVNS
jgi:V/A-type H+-transporting ATPase subunit G/H